MSTNSNEEQIEQLKNQIYHDQITKILLYFRLLNEETKAEFMQFFNMIFLLSEKKNTLTKEEIQLEILRRYFISQNNNDIFYILQFTNILQKLGSAGLKDRLMLLVKEFAG